MFKNRYFKKLEIINVFCVFSKLEGDLSMLNRSIYNISKIEIKFIEKSIG